MRSCLSQYSTTTCQEVLCRNQKKKGRNCKPLAEVLRYSQQEVSNLYRSYTVSYKLRVLSYWTGAKLPCSPTRVREATWEDVGFWVKIPAGNLSQWRKKELEGKLVAQTAGQPWAAGGGRGRIWLEMEKALLDQFRERRAMGSPVQRGWFCQVSTGLFQIQYPEREPTSIHFSNQWFSRFLRWHQISLQCIANTASKLPEHFAEAILV